MVTASEPEIIVNLGRGRLVAISLPPPFHLLSGDYIMGSNAKQFKSFSPWKDHGVEVGELEVHEGFMGGFATFLNLAAKANTGGGDQLDISGGGGTVANLVQPIHPRNVQINFTDGDTSITAFTVTYTGKDIFGRTITEVFTFAGGLDQVGTKIFSSITSIVVGGLAGNGAGDTFDCGYENKIGLPAVGKNPVGVRLIKGGAVEAFSAIGADPNGNIYFTPTTAPDGAIDYDVYFAYNPIMWADVS